jgi:glycine/D-amino acid oxidase-like deaminating enzyme
MSRLRIGRSYWLDAVDGAPPRFASLQGNHDADIVIVGAGVTGCAAALLFARDGARVIVVDRHRIGRGSTAASTALLMQEPDVDFGDLADRYGTAVARRIWRLGLSVVKRMTRMLTDLQAPDIHVLPSLYFTRDVEDAKALRHEAALRRRAGLPGRWLDPAAVARIGGFDAAGAILTPGNAQVDPYGACLALAEGARAAGARFYHHSEVRRIEGDRTGVRVRLKRGTIRADYAVIATGYATPEFESLGARFRMMNTYVIATEQLTAGQRRATGLGDVMLWDTNRPYYYARWTDDGRLLFGGLDRPRAQRPTRQSMLRRRAGDLMRDLVDLFPSLSGVQPEYSWEGLFANTPDGLPYIGTHRRYPRQLFALGYGGNGMTFGFMAAEVLVRLVNGRPSKDDDLFAFARGRGARRVSVPRAARG